MKLTRTIEQLTHRVMTLSDENVKLMTQIESIRTEKSDIESEKVDVVREAATLKAQLRESTLNVSTLSAQVNETESKLSKATETIKVLKSQVENSVREAEGRVAEIDVLKQSSSEEVRDLQESLQQAVKQHDTLKSNFEKCAAKTGEIFRVLRQMRLAINPEADVGEEEEEALDFPNRLVQELTTLRELFMSSYRDIQQLVNERTQLQKYVSELEKCHQELRVKMKNGNAGFLEQIGALEEANRDLQVANDMGEETRSKLSAANDSLRQTIQLMKDKLQESEAENRHLKQERTTREIKSC
jgi:chromosome segregation ATPase